MADRREFIGTYECMAATDARIDCKHSYTAKVEGQLRRMCGFVLGYRDRGERRG